MVLIVLFGCSENNSRYDVVKDYAERGKTEGGNIWLDREKTSPYQFYQYWKNVGDEDAKKLIKIFTFIPMDEINALITEHEAAPHTRILQNRLAEEITRMVHSQEDLDFAIEASNILFGKDTKDALMKLNEKQLLEVMDGVPQVKVAKTTLEAGIDIVTLLADTTVFPSKGEARKMIQAGGVSFNKEKVDQVDAVINTTYLMTDKYILIQKGKKNYYLLIAE